MGFPDLSLAGCSLAKSEDVRTRGCCHKGPGLVPHLYVRLRRPLGVLQEAELEDGDLWAVRVRSAPPHRGGSPSRH